MENITSHDKKAIESISEIIKFIVKRDNVVNLNPEPNFWRIEYDSKVPTGSHKRLCYWKVDNLSIAKGIVLACKTAGIIFSEESQLSTGGFEDENYGQIYVKLYYVGNALT